MLDHIDVVLALRAALLGVEFLTTGPVTLTATGTGFTRTSGSFITDGFTIGMEVSPVGFTYNTPGVITALTASIMTVKPNRLAQASGSGRSLTVGIPRNRSWENAGADPPDDLWYIREEYVPGPTDKQGVGQGGFKNHYPTYILTLVGLQDTGMTPLYGLADAILTVFAPGAPVTLTSGDGMRVREQPAPYHGQIKTGEGGRSEVVINIPLWANTFNPI